MGAWRTLVAAVVLAATPVALVVGWPRIHARIEWGLARLDPALMTIPSSGAAARQLARFIPGDAGKPLVVDLHQWGSDHSGTSGSYDRLDKAAERRGWSYIRPALARGNNSPAACCSAGVIDGVTAAIAFAKRDRQTGPVYVVGGSGGGYTTLCAALSGKVRADAYYAWVPITDLAAWYRQHRLDQFGRDILQCTSSQNGRLNVAEARRRSPLYMPLPANMSPIHIYDGIHDGWSTTREAPVAITHSIRMFNRLAPDAAVSDAELLKMLETRSGPDAGRKGTLGGRVIELRRSAGHVSLTVFDGAHEFLAEATLDEIARNASQEGNTRIVMASAKAR